jgi:hypothetical protein
VACQHPHFSAVEALAVALCNETGIAADDAAIQVELVGKNPLALDRHHAVVFNVLKERISSIIVNSLMPSTSHSGHSSETHASSRVAGTEVLILRRLLFVFPPLLIPLLTLDLPSRLVTMTDAGLGMDHIDLLVSLLLHVL